MKVRNKGKVHPSPPPSSHSQNGDVLSVLNLLPVAVLALITVLSLEDREVLAYMITRSISATNGNPPSLIHGNKNKKNNKNNSSSSSSTNQQHKSPVFDCECFDCYTSYWFKWDSSSNRELIHQAIEAFDEHLNNGEQSNMKNNNKGNKKKDKVGRRRFTGKPLPSPEKVVPEKESEDLMVIQDGFVHEFPENVQEEATEAKESLPEDVLPPPEMDVVVRATAATDHKGLARKVLPDVLGLFNSRLWNLWSPNV